MAITEGDSPLPKGSLSLNAFSAAEAKSEEWLQIVTPKASTPARGLITNGKSFSKAEQVDIKFSALVNSLRKNLFPG